MGEHWGIARRENIDWGARIDAPMNCFLKPQSEFLNHYQLRSMVVYKKSGPELIIYRSDGRVELRASDHRLYDALDAKARGGKN